MAVNDTPYANYTIAKHSTNALKTTGYFIIMSKVVWYKFTVMVGGRGGS